MYPLSRLKISFLGCGQMAQNLLQGYRDCSEIPPEQMVISGRSLQKTKRISEKFSVQMVSDNGELLDKSDITFICVKPSDGEEAIQSLRNDFDSSHTFISVMAGISIEQMKKWGLSSKRVVRLMPNTPVRIGKGFLPFYVYKNQESLQAFMEELFKPLGEVMNLEQEDLLSSVTVASASGVGFFLEILEYWVEWLQGQGFSYERARQISVQTLLGTGLLAAHQDQKQLMDLQKEVVSPKGVTASGLNTMRELELERILRIAFEKANLREQELSVIKAKKDT